MKYAEVEFPTMLAGDSLVPLESILCTEELNRRPSRAPDYEADRCALVALAQALADSPRTILQTMAEKMLEVFQCDSAGFSLLTKDGKSFYWPAIAGMWQPHIGGGTPRNFGPCGDVLDCNRPLLFSHWERRYPYLLAAMPVAEEGLLVPFYVEGKAVGTIWAIAHNDRRKFDAEDMRQLVSLGSFASSAYQVVAFLDALEERDEALRQSCEELEQRVVERTSQLTAINEKLREEILERKRAEKERKRADQELRESERRYRYIFQAAGVSIWEEDFSQIKAAIDDLKARGLVDFRKYLAENPEFVTRAMKMVRIVDVNEATVRLFGAESKDQLLLSLDKVFTPETEETFAEELIAIAEGRTYFESETIVRTLKGGKLTVLFTITFPAEPAKLDSVLVSIMDITERKRGETLFAGEKRLLEMIATGVALKEILDVLCQIIEEYRSGTLASVLLLRPDGLHLDSVAGPSLPKAWTQQLEKLPIGPCAGSCGTAAYRGSRVVVSDIATDPLWEVPEHRAAALRHGLRASWSNPILSSEGKVLGTFCIYNREPRSPNAHDLELIEKATDLARVAIERERAEEALRDSEEQWKAAFESNPVMYFMVDRTGTTLSVNAFGAAQLGYKRSELVGQSVLNVFYEADREQVRKDVENCFQNLGRTFKWEARKVRKDGTVIWVRETANALLLKNRPVLLVVCEDITDRKRAEEAVRRSEKELRDLIGTIPAMAFVKRADGSNEFVSRQWIEFSGLSGEQSRGSGWAATLHPEDREQNLAKWQAAQASGQPFESEVRRRDARGNYRWLLVRAVPLRSEHGKILKWYGTAIDIEDRKRAEEALRASEQLARSHVEVMMRSLDVLATESAPEKFIAEMLRTIGQHLHARGVLLWLRNQEDDSLRLRLVINDDQQVAPDPDHPFVKDPQAWKRSPQFQEMLFTKGPVVCDDIERDPRLGAELREYLMNRGRKKFLAIPMFVLGEVRGFIGIQHGERGAYRAEEIELAQALAHHVMIAAHEAEVGEQRRHAVILEERTRMARDIHDTLAQGFTGVIVQLEAVADAISRSKPKKVNKCLQRAADLARRSLNEARRSVHALRPEALERVNFWEALKGIIKNTAAATPIRTKLKLRGKLPQLRLDWQEELMRIGQEALTNTLKYAHADTFETRLVCHANKLRLEFQDDGDGFNVKDQHDGVGLTGMGERVAQMGGELKITSARGKGTKITVVLPCNGKSMS
jgi:PAS domain S-box-containing protein